ncbi:DoxX family protein [Flavobacterium sp. 245]|uniref:DoxX family protein n=1 Tax=Flavobacterium sp. 245 TaxID=2512115 RepID=UPI0010617439|nr:DoxX family protein [Flavobacterium sp. 245]TDO96080.1 putative membrane protein YphA (DoxX/SURF4 family) [Flavobacterium sp. 245]
MNLKPQIRNSIIEIISLLYVLLFVYATVAKILDFENFQIQLGQSPLLSVHAWWISWSVPAIEIVISILLCIPKCRKIGLFAALTMMVMFTAYIFIILNFSSFIPCSCGGILEKMGWNTHLAFNLIFVVFAVLAIVLQDKKIDEYTGNHKKSLKIKIAATTVLSIAVVVILFLSSESIMENENPFLRRYPQHPVMMTYEKDLKYNSYYFAGYSKGRIYLGNYSNPLHLISMTSELKDYRSVKIKFDPKKNPFSFVRILIKGDYFFLMDGTVPVIFRGAISDWIVNRELKGSPYFNVAVPIDSTSFVFRSSSGANSSQIVGVFSFNPVPRVSYNERFLTKQIDGVFDTDGMLLYAEKLNKSVYLYYYRNEFVVGDREAKVLARGNTIDTNSTAKIKIAHLKNGDKTMSVPALMVNQHSAICENLLFVHSKVKGQYELEKVWEQSSIIDVYDIEKRTYRMSFSVYGVGDKKLGSFYVTKTHLYALIGNHLVVHKIRSNLKNEFRSSEKED